MIVLLIVLFVVTYSSWCKLWSWRLCILPRKQWMCEVSTHCTAMWLCVPLFSGVSVHMYVCMAIVPIVPLVHLISWNVCAPCTPCKACFSTSPFLFLGGACWLLSGWPGASSPAPSHHLVLWSLSLACHFLCYLLHDVTCLPIVFVHWPIAQRVSMTHGLPLLLHCTFMSLSVEACMLSIERWTCD